MGKLIGVIWLAVVVVLCSAGASFTENCEDGKKMLDKVLANSPDEMTEEYFGMAVQQCPEDSDLYLCIAEYYKHWYTTDPNHEKQAKYKTRAEHYYRMALASDSGSKSKAVESDLAELESSRKFNIATFRALRPAAQGSTGSGLDVNVKFKYNSYELTGVMQENLDQLGEALFEDGSVTISLEGHTDMSGDEHYNKELSLKRAESVKQYIVSKFNIAPDRILTAGYGYERLAEKSNPYSAVNRRVEVIKVAE